MNDLETGSILDGRYEILGILGSGGMGCVYKARQLHLDRMVAIKVPSASVRENVEFLARFVREARACAKIAHDHIVAIYDVHSGQRPYIVMEFVDGMPLHHFLHEQATAIFISDLLEIIGQICDGLAEAHARGVIHRDIKPGNIVITRNTQRVKIMDFGIARISEEEGLTVSGSLMGTPYYMAPEQIRGGDVGPATDLYALAAVVYQLFTGRQVFEGNISSLVYKHVHEKPLAPSTLNSSLPESFDGVLLRALEKMPDKRQDSTVEFFRELRMAMRSLLNLPFSQVFSGPQDNIALALNSAPTKPTPPSPLEMGSPAIGDRPLRPVRMPAPAPNPSHESGGADPLAVTMQMGEAKQFMVEEPDPILPEEMQTSGKSEMGGRKKWFGRSAIWAIPAILVVAAGLFFWNNSRRGSEKTSKRFGLHSKSEETSKMAVPLAGANGTNKQTASPVQQAPVATPVFALRWVRPPLSEYKAGGVLSMIMWRTDPALSVAQAPLYRLSVRQKGVEGKPIWSVRTRQNRSAFHLGQPGEYLVRVELAQESPSAPQALEAAVRVTP